MLAAGMVKPGQAEVVERGARYAAATVALGLELVARGDVARAAKTLRTVPLVRLFRVGYTRRCSSRGWRRQLAPRASAAGSPTTELLTGLRGPRPLFPRVLDEPPAAGLRPFASGRDLRVAAELLTRLTLRIALAEDLGLDLAAMAELPEPRAELDDHLRTALARAIVVDGAAPPWSAAALTTDELRALRAGAFDGARLTSAARGRGVELLVARLDHLALGAHATLGATLAGNLLDDLEAAIGPLSDAVPDPRFVSGVLLVAHQA
ncbi:MAG: DUF6178 family protein [Kofleriaceae bacterium]